MTRTILKSFGAARTVTGSRHLINAGGKQVLLDCGLFQGRRDESTERNRHIPVSPDVVVLSHAHIDHCGALPSLVRDGFRGAIHATDATHDLCKAMLADVAKINEADARYANKKRPRGAPEIRPIYTSEDVKKTLKLFEPHPYRETFEVLPGISANYRDAGHIIGSAGVLLGIEKGPSIYFTGDIGRRMYPILEDPEPLPECDVVISESTYGLRDHEPPELAGNRLKDEIRRCIQTRGKLFIPAFSVGRTQNLVYQIVKDWESGELPRCPVYVDSPLAQKATKVIADHPECFDKETMSFFAEGGRPFYPEGVEYVEKAQDSKALNHKKGPLHRDRRLRHGRGGPHRAPPQAQPGRSQQHDPLRRLVRATHAGSSAARRPAFPHSRAADDRAGAHREAQLVLCACGTLGLARVPRTGQGLRRGDPPRPWRREHCAGLPTQPDLGGPSSGQRARVLRALRARGAPREGECVVAPGDAPVHDATREQGPFAGGIKDRPVATGSMGRGQRYADEDVAVPSTARTRAKRQRAFRQRADPHPVISTPQRQDS